jgi:hypothetical protein
MKQLFTLFFSVAMGGIMSAQTHHIHISIDTKAFPLVDCSADAGISGQPGVLPPENLYLHSGLCTSNAADCFDNITVINSNVWQHVVGNWQNGNCPPDGIGLMTHEGNGVWSIDIILEDYFTDASKVFAGTTSSGLSTVWDKVAEPTPFTLGYVFRTESQCKKGADKGPNFECMDYFIGNINTTPGFVNPGSTPISINYNPPGASFTTGIDEPNIIYHHQVSPNPVQEQTSISFFLTTGQDNFSMNIFDATGNLVKNIHKGSIAAGDRKITWDRTNNNGEKVSQGVYYFVMQSRNSIVTDKLIVID